MKPLWQLLAGARPGPRYRAATGFLPRPNMLICPPPTQHRWFKVDPRRIAMSDAGSSTPVRQDRLAEFTKDEDIETTEVQVKQPDGKLSEPQNLHALLQSLDRRNQLVVQLSKPGERKYAVVRVHDRMDLLKQVREREALAKQTAMAQREKRPKQLELNWAISEHDLDIKLKQMEQFLQKGKKVEILLASKAKQRRATREEAEQVLQKIRERMHHIGAREVKAMEGQVLRQAVMTVKKF